MVVINVILSAFINGVQKTNRPGVHAFGGKIPCNASSQCLTSESESVSLQFPVATEGRKLFWDLLRLQTLITSFARPMMRQRALIRIVTMLNQSIRSLLNRNHRELTCRN